MSGADRVELYTGPYGGALKPEVQAVHLDALRETADAGAGRRGTMRGRGRVASWSMPGHDLNLVNLPPLKQAIPDPRRSVDRPRHHRRCADLRHGRDGSAVQAGLRLSG
jgi:hypothetical protein